MRPAFFVIAMLAIGLLPSHASDETPTDTDPWVGKTRGEVLEMLGEPQKAKRSGGGEKLTYRFLRLSPSAPPRLDVRLIQVLYWAGFSTKSRTALA